MKKYINELFEVHKKKTFDEFLVDALHYHLSRVENNWTELLDTKDMAWLEYRNLLDSILHSLNSATDFIELTVGPDIIPVLYNEISNYVEDRVLDKTRVNIEDYSQIHMILAALGASMNPDILELGLFEDGQLIKYLTDQILSSLDNFGK